jgi:hypothetical protein
MLYNLPNEVLLMIFDLVDIHDLMELTLVCKKFNHIISSSARLMDKFIIYVYNDDNETNEWTENRKYYHLSLQGTNNELPKIIESLKNDLISLIFNTNKVPAIELKKILLKCTKLRTVIIGSFIENLHFLRVFIYLQISLKL